MTILQIEQNFNLLIHGIGIGIHKIKKRTAPDRFDFGCRSISNRRGRRDLGVAHQP